MKSTGRWLIHFLAGLSLLCAMAMAWMWVRSYQRPQYLWIERWGLYRFDVDEGRFEYVIPASQINPPRMIIGPGASIADALKGKSSPLKLEVKPPKSLPGEDLFPQDSPKVETVFPDGSLDLATPTYDKHSTPASGIDSPSQAVRVRELAPSPGPLRQLSFNGVAQLVVAIPRWNGHTPLPRWEILGSLLVLPCVSLWLVRRQMTARWRVCKEPCRMCGYDLRASPERCPECGTARK